MAWNDGSSSIAAQLRGYFERLENEHTRTMAGAWARAWDELAPDLEDALNELVLQAGDGRIRRVDVLRSRRLQASLEVIRQRLDALVDSSADHIIERLDDVVTYSGAAQERLIASQLPPHERAFVSGWSRVDPAAIEAIVTRTTEQITKLSFPLSDEAAASMRRELIRGVVTGSNPRTVAGRMVARTEGVFNGGLTRAMTIARTEMLDAGRAAGMLSDQANADVLVGWVWLASLSGRTCPACWGMHGQEFPLDVPGPDGHQNCRCARAPKTKTWAELGFTGITEPPSLLPDADRTFEALPAAEQRNVLGRDRFNAWKSGDFPRSDWATQRSTPGWRDSWVPAKAPAA